ncbi:MAG: hypothetical protein AUK47_15700 [Deltaproteobacteria bacterium CG2_30_63_29]|nr:MAG: hypothetical protein AUK47_15700 [Deltaproteobacteria bacterium CG2_30_63_29]PIW01036.1 MAG: hypothetical protein COW42_06140 [Deltaproteobacteria bacterium CG17_big_fil_post_rev_8_21_14_2_50_63_7]PJB41728.1 MAG: hypothetical protein CO108_12670 [Deltaproteobacteria bacterium CG_4_9_14_3_um_filter_63_12]
MPWLKSLLGGQEVDVEGSLSEQLDPNTNATKTNTNPTLSVTLIAGLLLFDTPIVCDAGGHKARPYGSNRRSVRLAGYGLHCPNGFQSSA